MAAIQIAVRGQVQGVGFRAFVQRTAITFGIVGEVWNAMDGSVGIFAQHPDELHLRGFARVLQDGPGSVDSLEIELLPDREVLGFTIGPGR